MVLAAQSQEKAQPPLGTAVLFFERIFLFSENGVEVGFRRKERLI